MLDPTKRILIYLDMVLLIMTAAWIIFNVSRGVSIIELIYNYLYIFVVTLTIILNMKIIYGRN